MSASPPKISKCDRPGACLRGGAGFAAEAGISPSTARRFLGQSSEGGVLAPVMGGQGRRAAIFAFPALLEIAEGNGPLAPRR